MWQRYWFWSLTLTRNSAADYCIDSLSSISAVGNIYCLLIADMLLPSLEPTLASLDMIPAILQRVDRKLYRRVLKAVRPPHFAASAVMTWFAHEIDDLNRVASIFDFLICSPPIMIFYLAAAVLPLEMYTDEGDSKCQTSYISSE
jgi:Rab-GTPase-TBC domain